jgi:hypothetical protein
MPKGSISVGGESLKFFCVLGAVAYLQVSPLGDSRDETWRGQGIRKCSVSWNLPKLSQLWRSNGGFRPRTTQNHLRTKQFLSGTWNSSRVAAYSFHSAQAATLLEFHVPLTRIVSSVGGSVWYVVWNLRWTVTIDSVLANSKMQNAFLWIIPLCIDYSFIIYIYVCVCNIIYKIHSNTTAYGGVDYSNMFRLTKSSSGWV